MQNSTSKDMVIGSWLGILAYTIWGFLPIYWKTVEHVSAMEVLAHRILWALIFMGIVLLVLKKWGHFLREFKMIVSTKKLLIGTILASLIISLNWLTYIYAVNSDRIIETSLGYYINPLITVLLGILVLKEKLSFWQIVSIVLAAIGVLILTLSYGGFPWISFSLAITFALYGLAKKLANLGALTGLTIETLIVTPIAFAYLIFVHTTSKGSFGIVDLKTSFFLILSGIATALPLLLFAAGAKRIPLIFMGFLQYIAPTLQLIVGVFLYHEPFTQAHMFAFLFIWIGLLIFTIARTKWMKRLEPPAFYKRRKKILGKAS